MRGLTDGKEETEEYPIIPIFRFLTGLTGLEIVGYGSHYMPAQKALRRCVVR